MREQFARLVLGRPYRFPESAVVELRYPEDMANLLVSSTAAAIRAARGIR